MYCSSCQGGSLCTMTGVIVDQERVSKPLKDMLMALNTKQASGRGNLYQGTALPKKVERRHKKNKLAKASRKRNRNN